MIWETENGLSFRRVKLQRKPTPDHALTSWLAGPVGVPGTGLFSSMTCFTHCLRRCFTLLRASASKMRIARVYATGIPGMNSVIRFK